MLLLFCDRSNHVCLFLNGQMIGRPDLTGENQSSRSTMPETRPNVVIATFGGNIEMLRANDTVIKFQDSSAARRQQSGRIRRAKPLVAEQSTQLTVGFDFPC